MPEKSSQSRESPDPPAIRAHGEIQTTLEGVHTAESRRILATLIRLPGDFDAAEDAVHDAFAAAAEQWVAGSNRIVPLEQIATVTLGKGPSTIQHADGKRMTTVSANVDGRAPGEVTADGLAIARATDFPPGYGVELAGASRDQQEVFREMGIALVSGIALMYLILVMQFGSFTAPLAVMLSLPLSLIGVVLALLLTGGTLNLMSFIGVIMLMGLGEERDPAAGCGTRARGRGHGPRGTAYGRS